MNKPIIVIQGVEDLAEVPGIDALAEEAELRLVDDPQGIAEALPGAQVLLGWDADARNLKLSFAASDRLRWIQWGAAGVDAALFPALVESDVVVTNARGIFDRAMAEYTLGMILFFAKDFRRTLDLQSERKWLHRHTLRVAGTKALVIGTGSIGREIARLLKKTGIEVEGVGRRARAGDSDFSRVHAADDFDAALGEADWVVLVAPLTPQNRGFFDADRFAAMKRCARFFNLGRGALVDEPALVEALAQGEIAGAGLDVFEGEPYDPTGPLWAMDNVIVSPHMSGEYHGFERTLVDLFIDNFRRFVRGDPLVNTVDKRLGFVSSPADPPLGGARS
ncbi:MAG: D-2-hydroxyacid dehydrogenase [Ectothiorhodospiraceae bacterium AqS1]|nr:D-2-hydroxyacid dehydrogenase [Ectothiorhodospiraceae bacterium AqS1]